MKNGTAGKPALPLFLPVKIVSPSGELPDAAPYLTYSLKGYLDGSLRIPPQAVMALPFNFSHLVMR
jgi:hypothetical protein